MKVSELKNLINSINIDDDDLEVVIKLTPGISNIRDIAIDHIIVYDCKIVISPTTQLYIEKT